MTYALIVDGILKGTSIVGNIGAGFKWVTGTILAGELSVVVTHNLGSVPSGYTSPVPLSSYGAGKFFLQTTNITATQATIEITDAQAVDIPFLFGVIA